MTEGQASAPKSKMSLADAAAILAVGLTVSAAALYSFGIAYLSTYLGKLGFDPHLFPIDFAEQVYYGGLFGYDPVYIVFVFLLLFAALGWAGDWLLRKWRGPKPQEPLKEPARIVIGACTIIGLWGIWLLTQQVSMRCASLKATQRCRK